MVLQITMEELVPEMLQCMNMLVSNKPNANHSCCASLEVGAIGVLLQPPSEQVLRAVVENAARLFELIDYHNSHQSVRACRRA